MARSVADPAQVREAVDVLFGYRLEPFVCNFVRRYPAAGIGSSAQRPRRIAANLSKRLLRQEIEAALNGDHKTVRLELDDLRRYLDELQESGRQHLYLLELPEARCRDLRAFDPAGFPAACGWIAEARDGPAPATVRFDPERELVLGWVETRPYVQFTGFEVDPKTGVQTAKKVPRVERSVSYFHGDLATGEAEIKLQKLQSDAVAARRQERDKYLALVAAATGCDGFVQLPLAPAIRRAMAERAVLLDSVTVVLPNGGRWTGGRDDRCPIDPSEVTAAVSLKHTLPATSVRVELDSRLDEVLVPNPCTPEQLDSILSQVRGWYYDAVEGAPDSRAPDERDGMLAAVLEHLAAKPPDAEAGAAAEPWTSRAACEQFLRHTGRVARREQLLYERETERLDRDERLLSRLYKLAAAIALAFVIAGGTLALALPDRIEIGTIGAVVGLVTGGGSLLIRGGRRRIDERLDRLRARQDESRRALDAIQAALAIADPAEQTDAMRRVATMLCERALRS